MNIEKRFRELAMKEATGTATPHEIAKLDRLSRLRAPKRTQREIVIEARHSYAVRQFIKQLMKRPICNE